MSTSQKLYAALVDIEESFLTDVAAATSNNWDINSPVDDAKMTLLHHACRQPSEKQTAWVKALLGFGASVSIADKDGNRALAFAAISGNEAVVTSLLHSGADVNAVNLLGESALIIAAGCGRCGVIEVLIAHGADMTLKVSAGEHAGRTALVVARACIQMAAAKLITRYPKPDSLALLK